MLLKPLSLALAAAYAHAGVVPFIERRQVVAGNSTSDFSSSAVVANLSVLNALPFPFDRAGANNATVWNVTLPDETTYDYFAAPSMEEAREELERVGNATVVAYQAEFLDIAGGAKVERVFRGGNYHEAPVYLPATRQIFLTPDVGSTQYLVDLNSTTLSNFTANPPVENVNGGTYHSGTLYVTTNGGNRTSPAVFAIDSETRESRVVVDNYFGLRFNSFNDIVADNEGNLIFNDPEYGFKNGFNPNPPQLLPATYLYNATTKITKCLSSRILISSFVNWLFHGRALVDGLNEPNGVAFSPDKLVLYAFNYRSSFASSKRLFHLNPSGIPDGLKVDSAGRVWSVFGDADTGAVEVINPDGQVLGLVQFPAGAKASNVVFVPPVEEGGSDEVWVVGGDSIWRISGLNVTGVRIE
ncbi:hypothetical protein JCM8547_006080 [Rhodosporidiobolus lusitaniae]